MFDVFELVDFDIVGKGDVGVVVDLVYSVEVFVDCIGVG